MRSARTASSSLHLDDIDESTGYYTGLRFRVYADAARKWRRAAATTTSTSASASRAAAIGFTFTIDDLD